MDPQRWGQVCAAFDRLADAPPAARTALLDELGAGDAELRREVEAMLAASGEAVAFLEAPLPMVQNDAAPVPAATTAALPDRLGPYQLGALLGAGGMGQVYRARDTRLDREVAIKVLPQATADDPAALARFHREAKAVAALSHPNIVAIFDFGSDAGVTYAVTELLQGETLRAHLRDGALPWRRACSIGAAVAEALAAAHAKGVVHRDVKPENVFIGLDGRVKILDFGLARSDRAFADTDRSQHPGEQTLPGTIIGSIGYMSPEQVRGERIEATSDVFSLGCVLHEMLTGQRPFQRQGTIQTLAAILDDDAPALAMGGAAVPHELEQVVARCLAKVPAGRFQSARDLAFSLEAIVQRASSVSSMTQARERALAAAGTAARVASGAGDAPAIPETRYAKSGDVNIAYQVVGERPCRPRLRHGVDLPPRVLLARALLRALPAPARLLLAADPLRQARHRLVGPRAARPAAHPRAAHGRRARRDGGGRLAARRAAAASPKAARCAASSPPPIPSARRRW